MSFSLKEKIVKVIILFQILFFFQSCETNPPQNPLEQTYGKISVSSNLDGSFDSIKIFLDGNFSGKFSPSILSVETGTHSVFLKHNTIQTPEKSVVVTENETTDLFFSFATNSTKKVLLEDFANVSCDPCVTSGEIIRNMLSGDFSDGRLVVLRFATNFPSPNDPFYLANSNIFDTRISFYNVLFAPTTIVDGNNRPTSTDSVDIANAINSALENSSDFRISIEKNLTTDSVKVSVSLNYPSSVDLTNLYLFTVLIKNRVTFSEPPGSNGETEFENVVVEMLPTADGIAVTGNSFNFSVPNSYGLTDDNYSVVSFIQNKITKEILQTNIK